MKFLLDVNTLIAFCVKQHQFHVRVVSWMRAEPNSTFFTSSITEIGFVRVVTSAAIYQLELSHARKLLLGIKSNAVFPLLFLSDGNDIASLPAWVKFPKQITDGHLSQLASRNGAVLATLDTRIPGAYLIP